MACFKFLIDWFLIDWFGCPSVAARAAFAFSSSYKAQEDMGVIARRCDGVRLGVVSFRRIPIRRIPNRLGLGLGARVQ